MSDLLRIIAAVTLAVFLTPGSGLSWGRIGHRVSARIAEDHLSPAAFAAVHNLIGRGSTLADIANWADEPQVLSTPGSWHYVNVPVSEPRYDPRFCPATGCVVSKIADFKRVLLDRNARAGEREQALRFLVHFIEDVHQPLHVGDAHNAGGNALQARFYGVGANLHWVWDSLVIEHYTKNEQVWVWELRGLARSKALADWSKGTPEDWATESLADAKLAFRTPGRNRRLRPGVALGDDYSRFALSIIKRRLAQAGVRLAWVLNEIFR